MANYNDLITAIDSVIKTNNRREITGQLLQNVLNTMVGSLGENYQLAGFATPTTNPYQPDQNVFYVASQEGVYTQFDNIVLGDGISFLMWKNGAWTSQTISLVTQSWVQQNFVSKEWFRKVFRVYDEDGLEIVPNDMDSVVDNIKAMVGLWTNEYLSALGLGRDGGGTTQTLAQLNDVQLGTLANGDALVYNSAIHKWENKQIQAGVDMSVVWAALAANTNEQINASHLTTALSGYVTTEALGTALQNYATQSWVNQNYATQSWVNQNYVTATALGTTLQNYATQSWVNQNFVTTTFFDNLFRLYNGTESASNKIAVNSTLPTDKTNLNIEAMFGFWTKKYISALGQGDDGSTSYTTLAQLNDVTIISPVANQMLGYDATTQKWKNIAIPATGVTSVALSMPTGFSITGSPITASGTFTVAFASGYSLPTTAKQSNWDTAYGWGNHASAGYALAANLGTASSHAHSDYLTSLSWDSTNNKLAWSKGGTAQTAITIGYASAAGSVAWGNVSDKPLTLTKNTTGFSIAGGTTSKTLTVSESYTLGAACAKGVTDNSSNADVTSTDTNLITGRTLYYQLAKKGYTTNTGTVTSVATGTGLTGGTITTSGTISINSTYQTYISHGESAYNSLGNYLPLAGGTMTGTLTLTTGVAISDSQYGGLLVCKPTNWTGVTSSQWGVGNSVQGVIRSSDTPLIHYRLSGSSGTAYEIIDSKGGQTINSSLQIGSSNGAYLQIGAIRLVYDSSNNAVKVIKSDGGNANFYATGGVSALGAGSESGGGGDVTWALLASAATGGRTIHSSYISSTLSNYATVSSLSNYATVSSLGGYMKVTPTNGARNANAIYDAGLYELSAGSSNMPFGAQYGIVLSLPYRNAYGNKSTDFSTQIALPNGDDSSYPNSMFYRTSLRSSWNAWQRVQNVSMSDVRLKTILSNPTFGIEQIANAPIIRYIWSKEGYGDKNVHIGSTAQYWMNVANEFVEQEYNGYYSLQYGVAALISAITVARKVMTHEEKIALLETRVSALEKENGEQEMLINSLQEELAKFKAA